MATELAIRFVVGGVIVSVFAVLGDVVRPKTLAGVFGAAPSVALATLALAYAKHGGDYASVEARSMLVGALAFGVYAAACVGVARQPGLPVWIGAAAAWAAWLVVALAGHAALVASGVTS